MHRAIEVVTRLEISARAEIGPGLVVRTTYGVLIAETRIGRNCVVQHGVAIYFGSGAKVELAPYEVRRLRIR